MIRAYIEHRLDQRPGVQKLYYIGPMFRRERPQKGRYRQFFQIGAEAIGSESPFIDAEVIEMVVEILTRAGLSGFELLINSVGGANCRPRVCGKAARSAAARGARNCAAIASAAPKPIRCACSIARFRKISPSSTNCRRFSIISAKSARPHFAAVQQYLNDRGIPFDVKPRLVRGLDYYMRTTFEVVHGNPGRAEFGARRRTLRRACRIAGIERACAGNRLFHRRGPAGDDGSDPKSRRVLDIFIAPLGEAALRHAGVLARELRRNGRQIEVGTDTKLKRAMELANKLSARQVLIIGDDEIAAGTYTLKDMATGEQRKVTKEHLAANGRE